jgi:magnesium-transporting ATPase (P-type)
MILDNYLSYNTKVYISVLSSGIWIYFRTSDCYKLIPRTNIYSVIFVMFWTYLNYNEPLFLPIGLLILVLYALLFSILNKIK